MNKFKIGDGVKVIDDTRKEYIGQFGVVSKFFDDNRGVYVKLETPIGPDTGDSNNNIESNERQFFNEELELSKNYTVHNILNEL